VGDHDDRDALRMQFVKEPIDPVNDKLPSSRSIKVPEDVLVQYLSSQLLIFYCDGAAIIRTVHSGYAREFSLMRWKNSDRLNQDGFFIPDFYEEKTDPLDFNPADMHPPRNPYRIHR